MELPELGRHCTVSSCNILDFLPFECDACHKIFCLDHQTYEQHNCTEAYDRNVLVPTCPLCNQPVPVAKGDDPNIKVNEHIQQECRSEKAKKLYTNRCSFLGCKKKELIPVNCNSCKQNFCLKHRFETNHNCQGLQRGRTTPGNSGAIFKSKPSARSAPRKPQSTALTTIGADLNRERLQRQQQRQQSYPRATSQPNSHVNEEEALRQAIAASLHEQQPITSQPTAVHQPSRTQDQPNCDEDEALARAIAASLNEQPPKPKTKPTQSNQGRSSSQSRGGSDCGIS